MNNDELMASVKKLREAMGLSQTEFGRRLGKGLSTVLRYETVRPPKGESLVKLANLARESDQIELASRFERALAEELTGVEAVAWDPVELLVSVDKIYRDVASLRGKIDEAMFFRLIDEITRLGGNLREISLFRRGGVN